MALKTKAFDIAEHLNTTEDIRAFIQEVAATGDESDFIHTLNITARAMGMTEIARKAGVTRASLSKSLAEDGNPRFETISKVTKALGCKLVVVYNSTRQVDHLSRLGVGRKHSAAPCHISFFPITPDIQEFF